MSRDRRIRPVNLVALLLAAAVLAVPAATEAQRRPAPVSDPASVEARLKRLESMLNSAGLVDLLDRVDRLQQSVQAMRGELEMQAHTLSQIKQRQRELYIDVDRRVQRLESGEATASAGSPPAAGAPAPGPSAPPPAAPAPGTPVAAAPAPAPVAPAAPTADSVEEQSRYQKAFDLLKEGRYEQAATSFKGFLERYPEGKYADNAQYWLGEAYYVTRKFPESMKEFQKLLERHPNSSKLSHGMLKMGYIHYEQKNIEEAKKVLGEVVSRYPKTTAARLARERLERIRVESAG